MISKLKYFYLCVLVFWTILDSRSQGYIVPNGVTYEGPVGVYDQFDVIYDPATSGYTGFFYLQDGKTPPSATYINTFIYEPLLNTGVRAFFVSPGAIVDAQTILSGQYTELIPQDYVFTSTRPFYVGLYTGNQPGAPANGVYSDPLFGWAELQYNQGRIGLLASALEYQGGGIIVGTQTILPVPEPSTIGLVLLGAGSLFFSRQKLRSKKPIVE